MIRLIIPIIVALAGIGAVLMEYHRDQRRAAHFERLRNKSDSIHKLYMPMLTECHNSNQSLIHSLDSVIIELEKYKPKEP